MRKLKLFYTLIITFLMSLFLFACGGKSSEEGKVVFDNYTRTNDNEAVIKDVDENYSVLIKSSDEVFNVLDNDNNNVEYKVNNKGNNVKELIAKSGKWAAGEEYEVRLKDEQTFVDINIKKCRVLKFNVKRPNVEKVVYKENVVEASDNIHNINDIDASQKAVGNIILYKDENGNYNVKKISNVLSDGTVISEVPKIDEVIEELDIYGTYKCDVDEIEKDENIRLQILQNVRKSSFFDKLVMVAYAGNMNESFEDFVKNTDVDVKIKKIGNDKINLNLLFTFNPKSDTAFGEKFLEHHSITLNLDFVISPEFLVDFKSYNDLNAEYRIDTENKINFSITYDGTGIKDDEVSNSISKKLEAELDMAETEIRLFQIPIRIPALPMIGISVDFYFVPRLGLAVDFSYEHSSTTRLLVGWSFKNGNFKPSGSFNVKDGSNSLKFDGRANASAGILTKAKINVISDDLMYIDLEPDFGIYADLYGKIDLVKKMGDNLKFDSNVKFELGGYAKVSAKAYLNYLIGQYNEKVDLLDEKIKFYSYPNTSTSDMKEIKDFETGEVKFYIQTIKEGGRNVKVIAYDSNKNKIDEFDIHYDDKGRKITGWGYRDKHDDEHSFLIRMRVEYSNDGKTIIFKHYNNKNDYEMDKVSVIRYCDDKELAYEQISYNDDGTEITHTYYERNAEGNLIKERVIQNKVGEEHITYYDGTSKYYDSKSLVKREYYDRNGVLTSVYDKNGNKIE